MGSSLHDQRATSALAGSNATFLEALYEDYLRAPDSVPESWRAFFAGVKGATQDVAHAPVVAALKDRAERPRVAAAVDAERDGSRQQGAVARLVQVYANRGHLIADIDPLGMMQRPMPRVLDPEYFGLSAGDFDQEFFTGSRATVVPKRLKLRDLLTMLRQVFCGHIGAEFAHISDTDERLWLQDAFWAGRLTQTFSAEERRNLLWQLTAAEGLERYLHTRYVGQKRFSLEGGDALIPLIDDLIQQGGAAGVEEVIIGMAHRGRLNMLVNVLGKSPAELFSEFEGNYDIKKLKGSGDVKYHKGYSADLRTPGGNVHVALAFNPSHLEVVNPVVEGSARARQERRGDGLGERVLPVQIHGDSAFAGQGVVMETLQLSQARGFFTGGTVHIVINNQVGFTTHDPRDTRSTLYCSDVAKMIEAPIFHVNADDPEAVVFVARQALAYRQKFHKDVVIDLVCYRRLGHNEADEPAATQPLMYQVIRKHPTARQIYAERLVADSAIPAADADALVERYRSGLDEGRPQQRAFVGTAGNKYTVDWSRHIEADWTEWARTGVPQETLRWLGGALTSLPADFTLHPRVAKIVEDRRRMLAGELPLDWGCAETLAYATLLKDGYAVRLTGQDAGRGTFFHRHAVLHDQATGRQHIALKQLFADQPRFTVIDSVLSEEAVMGFEYGYSTTDPETLVIWEGQFGDFANGAQVIIDQFITSGEAKWGRLSGLTLFLPHGYEGQGPEHSSARLERFLQLCAENNIQVCVPSTPAQMYHMLRRQMLRALRRPLIVMTPKSLLRHKLSVSPLEDLSRTHFHNVLDDDDALDPLAVRRIVLCSGKVYFDLLEQRRADAQKDVALVRLEQIYPFPADEYRGILDRYKAARQVVWCQEEPQNQGAWYQIRHRLQETMGRSQQLLYAGRAPSAAPAAGILKLHVSQQQELVRAALQGERIEESARETSRLA
jgi:2-oxoglutarate dehydrogenase E1 component